MLREFRKFKGWVILEFFLTHPSTKIHFKELVRKLRVSPRTAQIYLKTFEDDGILTKERVGNLTIFSLNNELQLVRELKKAHFLLALNELGFLDHFLKGNSGAVSLALYGSCAEGTYDEKSDIDFLVVKRREVDKRSFKELEKWAKKEVLVTCMEPVEWNRKAKEKDPFYRNVVRKHILLYGADLVVE